jgi:hypothetical protein
MFLFMFTGMHTTGFISQAFAWVGARVFGLGLLLRLSSP